MTTIVKHRRTGNQYILLGINGEGNKANPSRFISELFNQDKSEVSYSATVCDVRGNMFLAYIDDLVVVEIDGIKPEDILPEASYEPTENVNNEDTYRSPSTDFDEDFDEEFDEEFESDTKNESVTSSYKPMNEVDNNDTSRSPATDFDEEFNEEFDEEFIPESDSIPKTPVSIDNSLDAPNREETNDNEDWI